MMDSPATISGNVSLGHGSSHGVVSKAVHNHLELLAEMGRDFVSSRDLGATLKRAVVRIAEYVDAEAGALFMLSENGLQLRCDACVGPVEITGMTLAADQGIVGRSVQTDGGSIVRDVAADPNFHGGVDAETGFRTRSILCAPMSVQGERIGAIELINKRGGDGLFNYDDLNLLQALATSAGLAVLNARMAEQLVGQERIKRELELAAEIQRSLLPPPTEGRFPVKGINVPARVVSGDFFDYYALEDGRIAFTLGDVSGKGMNAALMMAKTASLLRCLGKSINEPGRLLALVNDEICETATRGMFVTLVHGVYDPESGYVRLANAGHEPPLYVAADGTISTIEADAPPLGISPRLAGDDGFPEREFNLAGGALYIFTDGVTEGYLADGQEFGIDRLRALIGDARAAPQAVLAQVAERLAGTGQVLRDDLTMLVIDDSIADQRTGLSEKRAEPGAQVAAGEKLVNLRVSAKANRLRLIRQMIEETARFCGLTPSEARDVVLAVDEACQNVIRHAYGAGDEGDIAVEVRQRPDEMVIIIRDFAETIDVAKVKPRALDEIRPGGLGTHLIREVMDEVDFLPPPFDGGNLLRLVKRVRKGTG